jgi:hypothetical protein
VSKFANAHRQVGLQHHGRFETCSDPAITISPAPETGSYDVEVKARSTTRHRVTISADYLAELGLETSPAIKVLHAAFAFLLEREPNTSILPSFDLREIERYFPEFRREIARRLPKD